MTNAAANNLDVTILAIAKKFHEIVHADFAQNDEMDELEAIDEANVSDKERDEFLYGSKAVFNENLHNHIDPNPIMAEAYEQIVGESPYNYDEDTSNEETILINAAWELAATHGYAKEWN